MYLVLRAGGAPRGARTRRSAALAALPLVLQELHWELLELGVEHPTITWNKTPGVVIDNSITFLWGGYMTLQSYIHIYL